MGTSSIPAKWALFLFTLSFGRLFQNITTNIGQCISLYTDSKIVTIFDTAYESWVAL